MQERAESYWWYITVCAKNHSEELLHSLATETGAIGSELQELPDGARLRIYYLSHSDVNYWRSLLLKTIASHPDLKIEDSGKIENQQWHVQSEEAFPPLSVGERFVVLAPWHRGAEPAAKVPLYINPGSAFGTGYHESTQIALTLLEKNDLSSKRVLDLGTGSGILSIAAVKQGASVITARDIDPIAIEEVAQNLALNGISKDAVSLEVADLFKGFEGKVDLLIANILFDILIPVLPDVSQYIGSEGVAIFSGLLLTEREGFIKELEQAGLKVVDECIKEDWWGVSAQVVAG